MSRVRKKRKRDYQPHNLQNPFFKRKKRGRAKKKISWRSCIIILIILAIVGGAFWFFYLSNTFIISKIEVIGLTRIDSAVIKDFVYQQGDKKKTGFIKQKNLFVFNDNLLIENLQKRYNFAKIDIEKLLPDTLEITIEERTFQIIWLEEGNYYFIDQSGFIIEKINELEKVDPKNYPIIDNSSLKLISNQQIGADTEYLEFILTSWQELKNRPDHGIVIEKFIIKNNLNSLDAKVINGPVVYLNIKNSPQQQIMNLVVLKAQELNEDFFSKTYIDLRYKEKIYYY